MPPLIQAGPRPGSPATTDLLRARLEDPGDRARLEAFTLVRRDDAEALGLLLSPIEPDDWRAWRDFAGNTLYQVAEDSARRRGGEETRCLRLLGDRLRALNLQEVHRPKAPYRDVVQEVPGVLRPDLDVETPEKHFHKRLRYVPDVDIKEVAQVIDVPQIVMKEELKVLEQHVEVAREVPRLHIKEMEKIELVKERKVLEPVEQALQMSLQPVDRTLEVPVLEFRERLVHVPRVEHMPAQEETAEVPAEVFVPKPVIQETPVKRTSDKKMVVPCVTETPISVDVVEEVVRIVEVPETTIIQNIRYVPKFVVDGDHWTRAGSQGPPRPPAGGPQHGMREELAALRRENEGLARESSRMRDELASCARTMEALRAQLEVERRDRAELMKHRTVELAEPVASTQSFAQLDRRWGNGPVRSPHLC